MHEKILGHCKNNFENSLIFSKEKKKKRAYCYSLQDDQIIYKNG